MFIREKLNYEPQPLPDRAEMSDADSSAAARAYLEHMQTRHTVRDFSSRPVPREIIEDCIRTAGLCLLYTSPSPRDVEESRMPSSA